MRPAETCVQPRQNSGAAADFRFTRCGSSDLRVVMRQANLISPNVRREAREYLVGWTLGEIGDLFHDHGFSADTSHDPGTSGQRRTYVEQFYYGIDWTSREHVDRVLPIFEALIDHSELQELNSTHAGTAAWSAKFTRQLARDGIERDSLGRLRPRWASISAPAIEGLSAESSIPLLLRRMWDNVEDDPDAAIGAAKEAIEATAKHILSIAGETVSDSEKMPGLISRSHDALGVHARTVDSEKRSSDAIRTILGSLSKVALGINELRRDYGTGHGRPERPAGLSDRHARLAAQAADAWVRFMLETADVRGVQPAPDSG